jgi:hypothetical protein
MPTALKLKPYPGVSLVADKAIETNATADALAQALSNHNLRMHDLQTEFIARRQKLTEQYLAEVSAITGGEVEE